MKVTPLHVPWRGSPAGRVACIIMHEGLPKAAAVLG